MNFLVVNNLHIQEFTGGVGIYVHRYIEELNKQGHSVTLLVMTKDRSAPEYEVANNIKIHRVYTDKGNPSPLRFSNSRLLTEKAEELIVNNSYDIVNIHSAFLLYPNFLRKTKAKYGYKLVYTFHASYAYELWFDLTKSFQIRNVALFPSKFIMQYILEFVCLKYADKIIVMSEYVKSTIQRFYGDRFLNKVFVSAIGVSNISELDMVSKEEARRKLGIDNNKKVFISVRRLAPRMGLFNLIDAFKELKDESAFLYIIGKGELHKPLSNYIKKLNLDKKIKLAGFVENNLLHYYYCAADCFVLPTEELEGFGIATIEALSYNLPVIGTPKGATPEILTKFDRQLITHDHKPLSILNKLNFFVQNHQNYTDTNFNKLAYSEYNWPQIIDKMISAIKS